jgi:ATP-dependent phosphoenolpyruvate carboxykinase
MEFTFNEFFVTLHRRYFTKNQSRVNTPQLHRRVRSSTCPAKKPNNVWKDKAEYDKLAMHLAGLFKKNFAKYEANSSKDIIGAGPLKFE